MSKLDLTTYVSKRQQSMGEARAETIESPRYRLWRRDFMRQRLELGLRLAIVAYLTFIGVQLLRAGNNPIVVDPTWIRMAGVVELSLVVCLLLLRRSMGQHHPEVIFLAASWSITLIEQVWATLRGYALPGLFAWTLVFLTQATLTPIRWKLHLVSQLGVLIYYYGVNGAIGLHPLKASLWDTTQLLYLGWFCGICDLSVFLYERLQRSEFHAHLELAAEQERSERLLLNILPAAVAQQLKQNQQTIAESFAEATVLFADIVGFTEISAGIPPQELVTLLNQIFSSFDRLADRHGLEKIKTIGDSYMVVGGLPLERADHVEAIANMALDMQESIAQFSQQQPQTFRIRIGINTGPVVAGVIGRKKFIYDLWGDTVNVASRMESQGLAGRIQVTEAVYERLKHRYCFERRGVIPVKGKGEMAVYLLQGRDDSSITVLRSAP